MAAGFDIPLSIFHYKDYNSDFLTSWYNVSSEVYKEINRACPEKKVLNLALSVLMFPYIVFTALGLVIYNKFKTNDKTQISLEENKTKKSEVSESTAKRLAYGVLAAVAILVSIPILLLLLIPATPALATFYLLNRELSHSLVAALKISMGLYHNKYQNVEVSFHETEVPGQNIAWDMETKFPPQFKQLLRDLYEDKDGSWFNVARDSEHNTILKLSANIHLKNGLVPLRNEIGSVIATSIQGFTEAMGELLKLDKKDITYDKLKELLNEFRLKVVDSVDSKLISHLIQDAHRVAFIQAIKIAQKRREEKEDFSLEERLKEVLVEQELKSQGKELPTEKEMILKDLKKAGAKVPDVLEDKALPMFRAKWRQLIQEKKIAKRTVIDVYRDMYHQTTEEALSSAEEEIECLRKIGQTRYNNICNKLKEIHQDIEKNNSKDGALKRKLEDLFKFEYDDQEVEKKLIESRIRKAKVLLSQSGVLDKEKQGLMERLKQSMWSLLDTSNKDKNLMTRLKDLEKNEKTSDKVNDFIEKMYLEITKRRIQELFEKQGGSIKNVEDNKDMLFNGEDEKRLVNKIVSYRKEIGEYFTQPARLKEIIGKQNENLDVEKNSKEKESSSMELIELCLKNNQEILKALEDLESEKEELLINEEAKNDYREELTSHEKIKFAIIEDKLLEVFKHETFDEEAIKKLLEKAEFEYCLAEKCIKGPVIKTKDNIKHFCQNLLSPLIDRLVENIINNVPKNDKSPLFQPGKSFWTAYGYIKTGLVTAIYGNKSTEGKALDLAHDTHKEVETFLQYFESSYEEVGALVGDVFSDDGETFKKDIWPKIKDHLCGMWDRFFKDIEFTLISKDKNTCQETEEAVKTKLDGLVTQTHSNVANLLAAGA